MLRNERNAWIHAVSTVLVLILGLTFSISRMEWVALILAMGRVRLGERKHEYRRGGSSI